MPSRTDARPRVLIEAAAAGKARIASNIDGIPTLINDGVDGLLVEPENVDELAEKMSTLMTDQGLRSRLGVAAAERARSEFSEQSYVVNFMSFIRKVLSA